MNLLTETLDYMKELGKTPDDVLYVKMTKHTGFWNELNDSYPDEIIVDFDAFKKSLTTRTTAVMVLTRLIRVRQSCLRTTQ